MIVNHVRDVLIIVYSLSGNTLRIANLIKNKLIKQGCGVDLHILDKDNPSEIKVDKYDLVFIGSPTYGVGGTPKLMREFLRHILKEKQVKGIKYSVFGSGDSQFGSQVYCRAVDEIEYHLKKHENTVVNKIKIEQNPVNNRDVENIYRYVSTALREEQT